MLPVAKPQFLKQRNMVRVLWALGPVLLSAVYYFGWRAALLVLTSLAAGFVTEWIMVSRRKGRVSMACFVTGALLGLSLPSTLPFWMAAVAAVVAVLFAKEAFGGFGKNVFNPAVVGRAFVYVCFPVEMTTRFVPVFSGFPGGFSQYGVKAADAMTAATPMLARRDFGFMTGLQNLFSGNIGGAFEAGGRKMVLAAGSLGEVSAAVILLGAVYLIATKTARWQLMAATLLGAAALNVILRHGLGLADVPPVPFTLCSGALLYGAVFMVTDPISAPKSSVAQWIYGLAIGMLVVLFRYKAVFIGGLAFAVLIGNMLAPSLDLWIKRLGRESAKT
jgi:Na+-transporting NADH:ubiquinone oxidoreductase subunit B